MVKQVSSGDVSPWLSFVTGVQVVKMSFLVGGIGWLRFFCQSLD